MNSSISVNSDLHRQTEDMYLEIYGALVVGMSKYNIDYTRVLCNINFYSKLDCKPVPVSGCLYFNIGEC